MRPHGDGGVLGSMVPKLIGSDVELGNTILGRERTNGTGAEAARLLLRQIDGVPSSRDGGRARRVESPYGVVSPRGYESFGGYGAHLGEGGWYASPGASSDAETYSRDWGRKFLETNGGAVYIDLAHLELCTPEILRSRDFVAASRAMLRIARCAIRAGNAELPPGERLFVTANNSDGLGSSYGGHLNFLISRHLWHRLFEKLFPDLFVLAAFQASCPVITGQGKVGAENGRPGVDYQLSQRADFIETLIGPQTTCRRPLINTRDEAHCGDADTEYARLHSIFFDTNRCQLAEFLKVGTMQLVLAMLEAGEADRSLILRDPVNAAHTWSHDPDLTARVPLADGSGITAVELQRAFLEAAKAFGGRVGYQDVVPDAGMILEIWEETIAMLEARDFARLRRRLDWVLKKWLLERALAERSDLDWGSPGLKHLDLLYASLDEEDGLFWPLERGGLTDRVVLDREIEAFTREPPEDTRAWGRAMLLRAFGRQWVESVDWDRIAVRFGDRDYHGTRLRTLSLADPLGFTRRDLEVHLRSSRTLGEFATRCDLGEESDGEIKDRWTQDTREEDRP